MATASSGLTDLFTVVSVGGHSANHWIVASARELLGSQAALLCSTILIIYLIRIYETKKSLTTTCNIDNEVKFYTKSFNVQSTDNVLSQAGHTGAAASIMSVQAHAPQVPNMYPKIANRAPTGARLG